MHVAELKMDGLQMVGKVSSQNCYKAIAILVVTSGIFRRINWSEKTDRVLCLNIYEDKNLPLDPGQHILTRYACGWTKNGWVANGWERFEPKLLQSYCNSNGDIRLGATKVSSDFKESTRCYFCKCCRMGPAFLESGLWNPRFFPMGFCSGQNWIYIIKNK